MVIKNILNQIINQDRSIKRLIVMINDGLINIVIFTVISFLLKGYMSYEVSFFIFQIAIILLFIFFRIYDNVIKHIGGSYVYKLFVEYRQRQKVLGTAYILFLYDSYRDCFSSGLPRVPCLLEAITRDLSS